MTIVKVLIDHVGEHMAGDIVKDAPIGLVHVAEGKVKNAATGELIAEIIEDDDNDSDELKELKAKAKDLKLQKYSKMNIEELKSSIAASEELLELRGKATELQITNADKLSHDELIVVIEAGGQGGK